MNLLNWTDFVMRVNLVSGRFVMRINLVFERCFRLSLALCDRILLWGGFFLMRLNLVHRCMRS